MKALRKAQISGHVGIRVDREKKDSVVFFFHDKNIDPELAQELKKVRQALGLSLEPSEFSVSFGATAAKPNEIAIQTRSIIRVLSELASYVEVPGEHLASGTAPPIGVPPDLEAPPFLVLSGCQKPVDPFVAVFYEGRWFWIEKSDFRSKRTMAYILVLLALADTGAKESLPVITIQAN